MSTPKPRIRPKVDPYRQRSAPPVRDPLFEPAPYPGDPLSEHDPGIEERPSGRVIFQEDDCLR
jgi:hypothetical protein